VGEREREQEQEQEREQEWEWEQGGGEERGVVAEVWGKERKEVWRRVELGGEEWSGEERNGVGWSGKGSGWRGV
jgi:hypothetical protein